jgi:hypothetical protein
MPAENSNNELRKIYEYFFYKYSMVPHALFVPGCDKPLLV